MKTVCASRCNKRFFWAFSWQPVVQFTIDRLNDAPASTDRDGSGR
jgi:hypothetical protein